ncbi:MAG TPA: hypothetical protein PKZ65_10715 [Methanoregulaceae archaeon]|nr:hypothetical protein [Methanoregulaceae archaeon]
MVFRSSFCELPAGENIPDFPGVHLCLIVFFLPAGNPVSDMGTYREDRKIIELVFSKFNAESAILDKTEIFDETVTVRVLLGGNGARNAPGFSPRTRSPKKSGPEVRVFPFPHPHTFSLPSHPPYLAIHGPAVPSMKFQKSLKTWLYFSKTWPSEPEKWGIGARNRLRFPHPVKDPEMAKTGIRLAVGLLSAITPGTG